MSDNFKDLITKMLSYDPERRPTIDQLKSHPWMTSPFEEKKAKSKFGEMIEEHEKAGTSFPQDLIYNLLIRAFVSKRANTFLVSGFPHSLDQALYVEKFIKEIKI